jgi:hypothetical protein
MSRFYVGQRVRIARPDAGSILRGLVVGDEAVIVSHGLTLDWHVTVAGKVNPFINKAWFPVFSKELEPLTPPHQSGD